MSELKAKTNFIPDKCYLFAKIIEGETKDGEDAHNTLFSAPVSQEGYNLLYSLGKELWDNGFVSKFEIALFDEHNKLFWHVRPDQINFEKNRHKTSFMKCAAEEYESVHSEDFQNDKLEMEFLNSHQKLWDEAFLQNSKNSKTVDSLITNAQERSSARNIGTTEPQREIF